MPGNQRLQRIRTLSRRLRWAVRAIVVIVVVAVLLVLLGIGGDSAHLDLGGTRIDISGTGVGFRLLLLVCIAPAVAVVLALLHQTDRLLGLYQAGTVFAPENGQRIRRSGQLLMVLAVLDTITGPLLAAMALSRFGAGIIESAQIADVSLDLNIGLFLAGVFVVVIGHVMAVGSELAEDQALTI